MRILCEHGYYKLYPKTKADLIDFMKYVGVEFEQVGRYYTFPFLVDAEDYAIFSKPYLGVPAIKTYAGKPWEILKENKMVYSVSLNKVIPIVSVAEQASLSLSDGYYVTKRPFLQAGAYDVSGRQLTGFDGEFSMDDLILYIRSVEV